MRWIGRVALRPESRRRDRLTVVELSGRNDTTDDDVVVVFVANCGDGEDFPAGSEVTWRQRVGSPRGGGGSGDG